MKVNVLFERAKDGYYSCFMEEELPDFGLAGYGDTAEAAKADFLKSYEEIKEMLAEEGKEVPVLEFSYKYDLQSFFISQYFKDSRGCWYKSVSYASVCVRSGECR